MVLLDTHSWIFLIEDPDRLTKKVRNRLKKEQAWAISSFSCIEVAMLVHKGRLETGPSLEIWMRN